MLSTIGSIAQPSKIYPNISYGNYYQYYLENKYGAASYGTQYASTTVLFDNIIITNIILRNGNMEFTIATSNGKGPTMGFNKYVEAQFRAYAEAGIELTYRAGGNVIYKSIVMSSATGSFSTDINYGENVWASTWNGSKIIPLDDATSLFSLRFYLYATVEYPIGNIRSTGRYYPEEFVLTAA